MYVVPEMLDMQRGSEVQPSICAGHLDGHATRLSAMRTGIKQELWKPRPKYAWLSPFHTSRPWEEPLCAPRAGARRWWIDAMEPPLPAQGRYPPPQPGCGCFSLTMCRLCSLCTLHVKLTTLPWLTPGSRCLSSCDNKHTQYLDFKGEDASYTYARTCTHKYIP